MKERAVEKNLVLFIKLNCPYCKKVLMYLSKNNIEVETKDANISENAAYLLSHGKRRQVPCLFIDGRAMYESDDIVAYFECKKNK